jgi:hypothetical protein
MKRFGSAAWSGNLRDGKGTVSTESHALDSYPYTFFSRYAEKPGTNPEELLGAAPAAVLKPCSNSIPIAPIRARFGAPRMPPRSRPRAGPVASIPIPSAKDDDYAKDVLAAR